MDLYKKLLPMSHYLRAEDWPDKTKINEKYCEIERYIHVEGVDIVQTLMDFKEKRCCINEEYFYFCLTVCCMVEETQQAAYEALPMLCTHGGNLLHFISIHQQFICVRRELPYTKKSLGWNNIRCKSIANWYIKPNSERLLYNVTKYKSRLGWTHQMVLKYIHMKVPKSIAGDREAKIVVLAYATKGFVKAQQKKEAFEHENYMTDGLNKVWQHILDLEDVKQLRSVEDLCQFITKRKARSHSSAYSTKTTNKMCSVDYKDGRMHAMVDDCKLCAMYTLDEDGQREPFQIVMQHLPKHFVTNDEFWRKFVEDKCLLKNIVRLAKSDILEQKAQFVVEALQKKVRLVKAKVTSCQVKKALSAYRKHCDSTPNYEFMNDQIYLALQGAVKLTCTELIPTDANLQFDDAAIWCAGCRYLYVQQEDVEMECKFHCSQELK